MTKATQAQIEAALRLLLSGHDNLYRAHWHYLSDCDPLDDIAAKPAREVLLALDEQRKAALTAAAEVGESTESLLSTAIENVKAETIERCAQIAENFRSTNHPYHASPEDQIAAEIRALKEK